MFRETKWHEYDGVNKYYSKLVAASKIGCNFTPKELEGEIASLIVANCPARPNSDLKFNLTRLDSNNLREIMELCRLAEAFESKNSKLNSVNAISANEVNNDALVNAVNSKKLSSVPVIQCDKCGKNAHRINERCPAIGQQCNNCKRWNHFKAKCWGKEYVPTRQRSFSKGSGSSYKRQRSNSRQRKHQKKRNKKSSNKKKSSSRKKGKSKGKKRYSSSDSSTSSNSETTSSSGTVSSSETNAISLDKLDSFEKYVDSINQIELTSRYTRREIKVTGSEKPVNFLIDTGTGVTVIDEVNFNKIKPEPSIFQADRALYGYQRAPIELLGMCDIELTTDLTEPIVTRAYIAKGDSGCLLDTATVIKLKLMDPQWCRDHKGPLSINTIVENLKSIFPRVFSNTIGCLKVLVITDCYSRFPDAYQVNSTAGRVVIPVINDFCRRFGYPKIFRSDCGAPFNGHEWVAFAKEHNIELARCTPHHHEANGLVESFMKNITKQRKISFIEKTNYFDQIKEFLAQYRATPHTTTGKTPSSLFFRYYAHHTRLPRPACIAKREIDKLEAEENDKFRKLKYKWYKERIGFFGVKNFKAGDVVRLRGWRSLVVRALAREAGDIQ
jgi:hypothetical protein